MENDSGLAHMYFISEPEYLGPLQKYGNSNDCKRIKVCNFIGYFVEQRMKWMSKYVLECFQEIKSEGIHLHCGQSFESLSYKYYRN